MRRSEGNRRIWPVPLVSLAIGSVFRAKRVRSSIAARLHDRCVQVHQVAVHVFESDSTSAAFVGGFLSIFLVLLCFFEAGVALLDLRSQWDVPLLGRFGQAVRARNLKCFCQSSIR